MQKPTVIPPINNSALWTLGEMYSMLRDQQSKYNALVQEYEKMMTANILGNKQIQHVISWHRHEAYRQSTGCRILVQQVQQELQRKNEALNRSTHEYRVMQDVFKSQLHRLENENLENKDRIKEHREAKYKLRSKNEQLKKDTLKSEREICHLKEEMVRLQHTLKEATTLKEDQNKEDLIKFELEIQALKKELADEKQRHLEEMNAQTVEKCKEAGNIVEEMGKPEEVDSKKGDTKQGPSTIGEKTGGVDRTDKAQYELIEKKLKNAKLKIEGMLKQKEQDGKQIEKLLTENQDHQRNIRLYEEKIKGLEKEITQRASLQWQLINKNKKLAEQAEEGSRKDKTTGNADNQQEKQFQKEKEISDQLIQERKEKQKLEKQVKRLKEEYARLEKVQEDTKLKMEELSERLAAEMNEKLSRDERNLENVSIASRPMNIAEEYQNICSTEWLDAKTSAGVTLSETTEIKKLQVLCEIYMISLKQSTSSFQILLARLYDFVAIPFETEGDVRDVSDSIQLNKDTAKKMESAFIDLLRINAEKTDITSISQAVTQAIKLNHPGFRRLLQNQPVQRFIEAVTRLTWKMVLQKPPMEFSQTGLGEPWQGDQLQNLHWGSCDPRTSGSKVICYIHPLLLHGDAVMAKGTVFLRQ